MRHRSEPSAHAQALRPPGQRTPIAIAIATGLAGLVAWTGAAASETTPAMTPDTLVEPSAAPHRAPSDPRPGAAPGTTRRHWHARVTDTAPSERLANAQPAAAPGVPGEPDSWVTAEFQADWGLEAINAHHAYARGLTGAGVRLALADTGVAFSHPEFSGKDHHGLVMAELRPDGTRCADSTILGGPGACYYSEGDRPVVQGEYYDPDLSIHFPDTWWDAYAGSMVFRYNSHGIHVAGTIAANRDGNGMHGVAFGADLSSARIFNDTLLFFDEPCVALGQCRYHETQSDSSAFSYMYAQAADQGVRAMNHSWGYIYGAYTPGEVADVLDEIMAAPGIASLLEAMADASRTTGMIQVVAAGNTSPHPTPDSAPHATVPAALPLVFPDIEQYWVSVVNLTPDLELNPQSNRCGVTAQWCIAAPGTLVASTVLGGDDRIDAQWTVDDDGNVRYVYGEFEPDYGYAHFSGTSMAAPHVTGALGLLFERFPYLTGAQVRDVMLTTARDIGEEGVDEIYGWGLLDLAAAIEGPRLLRVDTVVEMNLAAGGHRTWEGDAWDDWTNDIGGPGRLVKSGAGWLRLSGDNSFAGATVDQGILELSGANALGDARAEDGGLLLVSGTGSLSVDALAVSRAALEVAGSVVVAGDVPLDDSVLWIADTGTFAARRVAMSGGTADILGRLEAASLETDDASVYVGGLLEVGGAASVTGGELVVDAGGRFAAGATTVADAWLGVAAGGAFDVGAMDFSTGTLLVAGGFTSTGDLSFDGVDVEILGAGPDSDTRGTLAGGNLAATGSGFVVGGSASLQGVSLREGALTVLAGGGLDASGIDVAGSSLWIEGGVRVSGAATFADGDLVVADGGRFQAGATALSNARVRVGHAAGVEVASLDFADGVLEIGGAVASTGAIDLRGVDLAVLAGGEDGSAGTLAAGDFTFADGEAVVAGSATLLDATFRDARFHLLPGASLDVASLRLFDTEAVVNGLVSGGHTLVGEGSILRGSGTLGSLTVEGLLAPGDSIGTLTVRGDYVQAAGSTLEAELIPPDRADLVQVTGTATIEGGTLVAVGHPGNYLLGQRYRILSAAGGLAGTFDAFETRAVSPLLSLSLLYSADGVSIDVDRGASLASFADTPNRFETAGALDRLPLDQGLLVPLTQLQPDAAMQAVDLLSGEIHASTRTLLLDGSRLLRNAALDRGRHGRDAFTAQQDDDAATGAWVELHRQGSRLSSDGNGARAQSSASSMLVGFDHGFGGWRLGVFGGTGRLDANVRDRASSIEADGLHLGAHAGAGWGRTRLRVGYARSSWDVDSTRLVRFPGFADNPRGRYDADGWQAFVEAGYSVDAGAWSLEPYLQYAHVEVDTDAFAERGGPAALEVGSGRARGDLTTLGLRFGLALRGAGQAQSWLSLRANLGYRHAGGDQAQGARMAWNGGEAFTVRSPAVTGEATLVELGFAARTSANTLFEVGYSGLLSGDASDHGASARFSLQF